MGLVHVLITVPSFYFLKKTNFKLLPKSAWALSGLCLVIILSILFNFSIMHNGLKPILKVKYFLFGFLMITPLSWYFKNYMSEKKMTYLLYVFFLSSILAGVAGTIGRYSGFNPISMSKVNLDRNAGLFGMVLNYAHNLAFFQIILLGLIISKNELLKYVNKYFMYAVFIINLYFLYTTYTRGALLAFIIALPFYLFKKHKKYFLITIVFVFLSGLTVYKLSGKNLERSGSDSERLGQWKTAWAGFKERPIIGYGYLNFEHHCQEIKVRNNIGPANYCGHAHNNELEILATTGVVGFVFYLSWIMLWFIEMYKRSDLISNIGLPFIIAFLVGGFTQSTIGLGVNLFFIMGAYSITQINFKVIKEGN
jgi:O-antigen ligase